MTAIKPSPPAAPRPHHPLGLANLSDGVHLLEHPAGAVFVRIRHGAIVRAELAPWGGPHLVVWPPGVKGWIAKTWDDVLKMVEGGGAGLDAS